MKILRLVILAAALATSAPALAEEDRARLPENFIAFDPMVVPVLDDYRLQGRLNAYFTIQTDDSDAREKFASRKPEAVDLYMRRLTEFARVWVDPSRPVDVPRLVEALQKATDEFVPKSGSKVYILEVSVRR